jgi:hypothetical protein
MEYSDAIDLADELADLCRALGGDDRHRGAIAEFLDRQFAETLPSVASSSGHLWGDFVATLLNAQHENQDWNDNDLAAMWGQLLQLSITILPSRTLKADRALAQGLQPEASPMLPTVGGLLHGHPNGASPLKDLKEWARAEARQGQDGLPRALATAVYFASIAAARVHHGAQISKLEDSILCHGLETIRSMAWLDEPTRQVVQSAMAAP